MAKLQLLTVLLVCLNSSYASALEWPGGAYGLPEPSGGCPTSNITWKEGWRYHDLEDHGSSVTEASHGHHFKGEFSPNVKMHFCLKEKGGPDWPKGDYCLYKYGDKCPKGFEPGSIRIDDEDDHQNNDKNGELPSGEYGKNTKYEFCCRSNGKRNTPIKLPTSDPFYLFPCDSKCQKVEGMEASLEYIRFDAEDDETNNIYEDVHPYSDMDENNPKIFFCYYILH